MSPLGWDGKPERCLELVFDDEIEAYCSPAMLDELARVLEYDRLEFSKTERQSFLEIVSAAVHLVDPDVDVEVVEDDPDDDAFLECAVAVDADYVVSGDDHLLDIEELRGITVLSPGEFLEERD